MSAKRARRSELKPADAATIIQRAFRAHKFRQFQRLPLGPVPMQMLAPAPSIAAARRAVQLGSEIKGVDTDIAISDVLATTNTNVGVIPLNLIVPGSGSYNRIGRKAHLQSIRFYGRVFGSFAAAATTSNMTGNVVRLLIVWDRQPSGVLPTYDTIFGHTLPDGTEATDFLDPVRYDNMDRFRVMRDLRIDLNPTGQNTNSGTEDLMQMVVNFDELVRLPNLETVYSGQSSPQTIADISSGALYFIARAATNTATVNECILAGFARLRYTD